MFFTHCSRKFKAQVVWFLYDIQGFSDRYLKIGRCPVCKKKVCEIREVRIVDNKEFRKFVIGEEATRLIGLHKDNINYTSLDRKVKKCRVSMPRTIRFGVNKVVKVGKQTVLRQRAVDFSGNREIVREINI